ncbi:MAG: hypothetical protein EU548_02985 [Promethearchaeota archaeon]|nr:MAG: hypothetical protein EU548_02985 [Candidatus Lokiarchaeota archaeon]
MKFKKIKILSILTLFLLTLMLNQKVVFGLYYVSFLKSDKEVYQSDEILYINASWGLLYSPPQEISYVQVKVFDLYDEIIWNTSKYFNIGYSLSDEWNVSLSSLDLTFENQSSILIIKFYHYFRDHEEGFSNEDYSDEFSIKIFKKNITCGFPENGTKIAYGNILTIHPIFYEWTLEGTQSPLENYTILMQVFWNSTLLFNKSGLTNGSGVLNFNLSTIDHLSYGKNKLLFSIEKCKLYYAKTFNYSIDVVKKDITCEFSENGTKIAYGNILTIHPIFNEWTLEGTKSPLGNYTILMQVFWNGTLLFNKSGLTNGSGVLNFNLSTIDHLGNGNNKLIFSIEKSKLYYAKTFNYSIDVVKKDITCEFPENGTKIAYGNILTIHPIFYEWTLEGTKSPLENYTLLMQVFWNDTMLFDKNITTNYSGIIFFNFSSSLHLKVGINRVHFIIIKNMYFNEKCFSYEIELMKANIGKEIIKFQEIQPNKKVELMIFYYFLLNGKIIPLENQEFQIEISFGEKTIERYFIFTNQTGFLNKEILLEGLNLTNTIDYINITVIFNGTINLERDIIIKQININKAGLHNEQNNLYIIVFTIFLISIIAIITIIPIYYFNKKKRKVKIDDLTISI